MKRFTIPSDFGNQKSPFHVYIGELDPDMHPLRYQAAWLLRERGGVIPAEVMESFGRLKEIAKENQVSFEDLCVYALGTAQNQQEGAQETTDNNSQELTNDNSGTPTAET